MWGQTDNDDAMDDSEMFGDDIFKHMFGDMNDLFGGVGDEMEDLDEFIKILEGDNVKSFNKMFRDLGKGYRMKP